MDFSSSLLSLVAEGRQHEIFAVKRVQDLNSSCRLIFRKRRSKSCKDQCTKDVEFYEYIVSKYYSAGFRVKMQVLDKEVFGFPGLLMPDLRAIGNNIPELESITFEFKPKLCERYLGRACRFCVLNRIRYSDSYSYCPWSYFMGDDEVSESSKRLNGMPESNGLVFDEYFESRNSNDIAKLITNNSHSFLEMRPFLGQTHQPKCSLDDLLRSKFLKVLAGDFQAFFPSTSAAFEVLEVALEPFKRHAKHILHQFPLLNWNSIEEWLEATTSPALELYKELVSIRDVSVMITLVKPAPHLGLEADFEPLPGIGIWARVKLIDLDDKLNGLKVIEHAGQTREILDFLRQNLDFECYSAA
jgi:hypothetical protein